MLSRLDDYPIHQTPEPVAHPASSDRNVYDRYWFNGYTADGEFYFAVAMGLYPHRHVLDGAFSIVRGGEQHCFFASRRAPADPSETAVGPLRIEVLEPMRTVRVTLAENETGVSCELIFRARTTAVEEGRQTNRVDGRIMMDATRFCQFGRWEGEIRYAGQRVPVDPSRVYATKDRSWGIRPLGERDLGGAPSARGPQVFFLWSPIHWAERCSTFGVFEDDEGVRWHSDGALAPAYGSPDQIPGRVGTGVEPMAAVEHDISYAPGTRRAERAQITLVARSGGRHVIELEPLLCFRMKGIGYTHPEWGHGRWKGELEIGGQSWKSTDLDPMAFDNQHIQQVMRARMAGEEGVGVLEQICFGPHARYGFKETLDPA